MRKALQLVLLICIFSSTTLLIAAQGHRNPELRKALKAYVSDNIMPVLQEQRLKLETQLTAPDKRQLEQLRLRLRHLKAEQQELREAIREERTNKRTPLTDDQQARLRAHQQKRKQAYAAVRELAAKYKPQLQRIQARLADERVTWEADLKAITTKYVTETDTPGSHRQMTRNLRYQQLMRPVHFLLWQANAPSDRTSDTNAPSVFPNPGTTFNTISYHLAQAGSVKITLLNHQGASIRNLLEERKPEGDHTLEVPIGNLNNGLYFYKIETATGTATLRLLKK